MTNDQNEKKTKFEKVNAISNIIIAFTSFLTLIITSFGNKNNLPFWFLFMPYIFIFLFIVWLIMNYLPSFLQERRNKKIAKVYFPRFVLLVEEFSELTSLRMDFTMTNVLESLRLKGYNFQNREFAELSEWVTSNLINRLKSCSLSFNNLNIGLRDLHTLTHSYYRYYFIATFNNIRVLNKEFMTDNERKKIETAREGFTRYLDRFQLLCKEINKAMGDDIFQYYFEKSSAL